MDATHDEEYGPDVPLQVPAGYHISQYIQQVTDNLNTEASIARREMLARFAQEHPEVDVQRNPAVIHVVSFPHRGYLVVCHDDLQLAATYHIPHLVHDYQFHELVSKGFDAGFEFQVIHSQFDNKIGYGEYTQQALPEAVVKQLYGENYEGGE